MPSIIAFQESRRKGTEVFIGQSAFAIVDRKGKKA